jgi:hypothetical protein
MKRGACGNLQKAKAKEDGGGIGEGMLEEEQQFSNVWVCLKMVPPNQNPCFIKYVFIMFPLHIIE